MGRQILITIAVMLVILLIAANIFFILRIAKLEDEFDQLRKFISDFPDTNALTERIESKAGEFAEKLMMYQNAIAINEDDIKSLRSDTQRVLREFERRIAELETAVYQRH
jgi:flagellar basal body-associated protein FliL